MPRVIVQEAEDIIDQQIKCLDHGFIALKDYMGSDSSIVQAARVSTGSAIKTPEEDRKLIFYLLAHHHATPFEMVQLKFHMKLPIFVARQWIRHRTSSVNEYSMRYSEAKDEMYIPEIEQVRIQSKMNNQGGDIPIGEEKAISMIEEMRTDQKHIFGQYKNYTSEGIARELARINLPVATYTEWYWDQNLRNVFHLLELRMDHHAQYEIRVFANAMYELTKKVAPIACQAFEEYMWNARTFSASEMKIIREMINFHETHANSKIYVTNEKISEIEQILGKRGKEEFFGKLKA